MASLGGGMDANQRYTEGPFISKRPFQTAVSSWGHMSLKELQKEDLFS